MINLSFSVSQKQIAAKVDGGPYYLETSPFICPATQWTGFYMIGTYLRHERFKNDSKSILNLC